MASLKKTKKKKKKGTPTRDNNTKKVKKKKLKKKVTKKVKQPKVIDDEGISQLLHSQTPDAKDATKKKIRAKYIQQDAETYKSWPSWGHKFLDAFDEHKGYELAAMSINISNRTVQRYKRGCADFRKSCEDIYHAHTDLLERSAMQRATDGSDDLVLFEGLPIYVTDPNTGHKAFLTKKKYETSLTIFMLKGRRREIYYPENQNLGGTADDKAAAVRDSIKEIMKIMQPEPLE